VPLASLLQLWNTPAAYLFHIPSGPMRHIHCKLLLAFAFLLFTVPALAAETCEVKPVEVSNTATRHTLLICNTKSKENLMGIPSPLFA